jgi:hypothetical protein
MLNLINAIYPQYAALSSFLSVKNKKLETALSFVEKKNLKTLRSTASVSK